MFGHLHSMPLSVCEFRPNRRSEQTPCSMVTRCDVSAFSTVQHRVKVSVDDATLFLSSLAACRLQTEKRIGKICTLRQGVRNLSCFFFSSPLLLAVLPHALLLSAPCAWRRLGTLFRAVAITRSESRVAVCIPATLAGRQTF